MMRKTEEFQDKVTGNYYVTYELGEMDWVEFLKLVKASALAVDLVWVTEDVEGDMRNVSGTYTLDDVIESFDRLVSCASEGGSFYITVFFVTPKGDSGQLFIYPREGKEAFVSSSKLLEPLDELLGYDIKGAEEHSAFTARLDRIIAQLQTFPERDKMRALDILEAFMKTE